MSLSDTTPTLSYIGGADTTGENGALQLSILFDASINAPLFFEVLIIDADASLVTTPSSIVRQQFIYAESAHSTGISNQWNFPVPATDTSGVYAPNHLVRVRVYSNSSTHGLVPTGWSNDLPFHNPPLQQSI